MKKLLNIFEESLILNVGLASNKHPQKNISQNKVFDRIQFK